MRNFLILAAVASLTILCVAWQVSYTTTFDNVVVNTNITLGGVARNTWPTGSASSGTGLQAGDGAGGFEAADSGDVTTALGFTPINKAGDTGIGALSIDPADNTTALTLGGYSLTGANAQSLLDLSGTWNTSGNPSALKITLTDTASGITAKAIEVLGGAAGATALFSVNKAGQALFKSVSAGSAEAGTGEIKSANGSLIGSQSQGGFFSNGDGVMVFCNGAVNGFTSLGLWTDLLITRDAANTLQVGSDAATPTDQTIKAADGSGTDKVGADLSIKGGQSTGTGAGGAVILSTSQSSTTGSSLNAYSERFHAVPKFVNLTESTATTILTVPVAAANYIGFTATITVFASDGTDHQSKTSVVTVDAVAKTTTITQTVSQADNSTAASAGTLTCNYTVTDNGSNVLALKADATSSLTQTTLRCKIVLTAINSNGTAAFTEQ